MFRFISKRTFSVEIKTLRSTFLKEAGLTLSVRHGDITKETTDTIVSPANSHLQHDGGLAAVVKRAGGDTIQEQSDEIIKKFGGPIPTSSAVATSGGNLNFKQIIHTVGPIWGSGDFEKPILLRNAIHNSIDLAGRMGYASMAIPAVSSGIYGMPKHVCAICLFDQIQKYANMRETKNPAGGIVDIRLTNIDQPTVDYFVAEFDKRNFENKGLYFEKEKEFDDLVGGPLEIIEQRVGFGKYVPKGAMVQVHYIGKLRSGEVFDSSYDRDEPIMFEVGAGQVIKGWDEAIPQMRRGSKATLICPPHYAYGDQQVGPIPANSTLVFDIEIVDFRA